MVNMGVGQQYVINFRTADWEFCIFIDIYSLLHAAVNQDFLLSNFQIVAASGYFVIGSDKHQLHKTPLLSEFFSASAKKHRQEIPCFSSEPPV